VRNQRCRGRPRRSASLSARVGRTGRGKSQRCANMVWHGVKTDRLGRTNTVPDAAIQSCLTLKVLVGRFLHEFAFEPHGSDTGYLAVDIVIAIHQTYAAHLGADLDNG